MTQSLRSRSPGSRATVLLVAAVAWVALACGSEASASPVTPSTPSPQPATPTLATTSAPPEETATASASIPVHETPPAPTTTPFVQPSPTPDPFGSHDAPPNGVADSFPFVVPFGRPCRVLFPDLLPGPSVGTFPVVEVPGRIEICAFGFASGAPPGAIVTMSDGATAEGQFAVDINGDLEAVVPATPADALGPATIHVQQGDSVADGSFVLELPSNPSGLAVPDQIAAGDALTIWFAGLTPSSSVPAYLYRADRRWVFAARMEDLQIDDRGVASITLQSHLADAGGYLVVGGFARATFTIK